MIYFVGLDIKELKMMRYAAILLDLDGTLYDAEAAYEVALKAMGLGGSSPAFREARQQVKDALPAGHVSARNRLLYFKAMADAAGTFAPAAVLRRMEEYEGHLEREIARQWKTLNRQRLMEGLCARLPIVIVTNETTRMQLIKLRAMDPEGKLFHRVVTSEETGYEKPSPVPFRRALAWLGLPAERCLMVGDDPAHDIGPAQALGIATALTTEFRPEIKAPQGTHHLSRLDELKGIVNP